MKIQIVTMKLDGNNFCISRKLIDTKNPINNNYASCNIIVLKPTYYCKSGFVAHGFSSIESPIIEHDMNNTNESIDDFVKVVFSNEL